MNVFANRRDFITEIRIGVIGIGNMGKAHAKAIAGGEISGMRLTEVCDIISEKLKNFKCEYHNIEVEDDVTIFTKYAGGATGTFITTMGKYDPHKKTWRG